VDEAVSTRRKGFRKAQAVGNQGREIALPGELFHAHDPDEDVVEGVDPGIDDRLGGRLHHELRKGHLALPEFGHADAGHVDLSGHKPPQSKIRLIILNRCVFVEKKKPAKRRMWNSEGE